MLISQLTKLSFMLYSNSNFSDGHRPSASLYFPVSSIVSFVQGNYSHPFFFFLAVNIIIYMVTTQINMVTTHHSMKAAVLFYRSPAQPSLKQRQSL